GFRVELGEIEDKLALYSGITQCAAKVIERHIEGSSMPVKYLCAYFESETIPDSKVLAGYLSALLPEYMIPSAFVHMDKIPLSANGKIDKKKLPDPEFKGDEDNYMAPRNELEAKICSIWQEILGYENIGIQDDFFTIGGNSILLIRLAGKLADSLGMNISIKALMAQRTISKIAEMSNVKVTDEDELLLDLSSGDQTGRKILYCIPGLLGSSLCFTEISRKITSEYFVKAFDAKGISGKDRPLTVFEDVLNTHLNSIKRDIKDKNEVINIAGHSSGGIVAFEVAVRLNSEGYKTKIIVMDTMPDPGDLDFMNNLDLEVLMPKVFEALFGKLQYSDFTVNPKYSGAVNIMKNHLFGDDSQADYQYIMAKGFYDVLDAQRKVITDFYRNFVIKNKGKGYYKGGNIHFIYVSDLYDNEKRSHALKLWGNLCEGDVLAFETTGDHIAMLNKNNAGNTADIINKILKGV
ncbi:hypothetical protein KAJ27_13450, partial [bacterium]|nr:hypothetical protein [bacterium]